MRATDIIKEIQKLNPAEKQRLQEFLLMLSLPHLQQEKLYKRFLNAKTNKGAPDLIANPNELLDLVNTLSL